MSEPMSIRSGGSRILAALQEKSGFWRNIAETYGTRVILLAFALLITILVSRYLGPTGRGFFAVATTVGAIGLQFGNFGLHASNTYYVAQDRHLLATLMGNSLVVSFGLGGAGSILAGLIFWKFPRLAPLHGTLLLLALVSIPLGLAYMLLQNLLLGIQEVRAFNKIELAYKVVTLVGLGAVIWSGWLSPENMFVATLVGLLVSLVWVWLRLVRLLHAPLAFSFSTFKRTLGVGIKAYQIAFFGYLVLRIDLLMVQYILGAKQAGYYSISETLAENMLLLPVVIGMILFPKLSGMANTEEKLNLARKAVWVTVVFLLPVVVVASLVARPVVRVVFGEAFLPAVPAFVWLMPGSFFLGVETVLVQFLNSLGFPKAIVGAWLVVVVMNIGLNLWAIPTFGIVGASVVSTICYFAIFLFIVGIVWSTVNRESSLRVSREQLASL